MNWIIEDIVGTERIDRYLQGYLGEFSRGDLQKLIQDGQVLVEGKPVKKNAKVQNGQKLEVLTLPEKPATDVEPEDIPLNIVYEDEHLVVLLKPRNMVVHPGNGIRTGTLAAGLLHHYQTLSELNGADRPGIVHRLDKDTPGLMVAARTDAAHKRLAAALEKREIRRVYHALVWGQPAEPEGVIDAPVGRNPANRLQMKVSGKGRPARTHYRVLENFAFASLLEFTLETGRTHQIRVHSRSQGWPVMGDPLYDGREKSAHKAEPLWKAAANRVLSMCPAQMLQAMTLEFLHPVTGESMSFSHPPVEDFAQVLEWLRREAPPLNQNYGVAGTSASEDSVRVSRVADSLDGYYFLGVAGTGMSALAQYLAMQGAFVGGSDRQFYAEDDEEFQEDPPVRAQLEECGVRCFPQDGSGLGRDYKCLVVSTAIEESNPELKKARKLGLEVIHRSEMLRRLSETKKSIAVAGTSGKSTVTAMVFHILRELGQKPSLISGAGLSALEREGLVGNACYDSGEWLVFEADESDGTLVEYRPDIGLIMNLEKDHKEIPELQQIFKKFAGQCKTLLVNGDQASCKEFGSAKHRISVGQNPENDWSLDSYKKLATSTHGEFRHHGQPAGAMELTVPGIHNAVNALFAVAAVAAAGIPDSLERIAGRLKNYEGIYRRHQVLLQEEGRVVIDDFAHNPAKIAASIQAAREFGGRILAWFQPHGFAPTRFLRKDLVDEISKNLQKGDEIYMSEIFFAGGTVSRDISAGDLIADLQEKGVKARFFARRKAFAEHIAEYTRSGDVVLLMGARDPSLGDFARQVAFAISEKI